MSSAPAIRIRDLRVDYGNHVAVDGVSLDVQPGEICGLVGPNGAGKSSTFRVLATLQQPTYGGVHIAGHDLAEAAGKVRRLLGYMPDLAPVPGDLQCWEFLDLFAASHGLRGAERSARVSECLETVHLADKRSAMCKSLSRGMMQRLVLAKTLLHRPSVLLLDEPASGMDPVARVELRRTLRALAVSGAAVLVSSHILTELADMCTTVAFMQQGKIIASGPVSEITERLGGRLRELRLVVLENVLAAAASLETVAGISQVQTLGQEIRFQFSGDDAAQAALLRSMLAAGFVVKSLEERRMSIEDIAVDLGKKDPPDWSAAPA
ncbi:MAG: ABC transporter ATP-binding protein [Verrucomicrobiales bacterium]|nr:ABC transporter ATP-binding protein [Verrucomicrobiales bacterium]